MVLFTEIQNYIFHHPYFKTYVIEHMKLEKETDGKMRGFMYVEKIHLKTFWSYKTITEEIKILH